MFTAIFKSLFFVGMLAMSLVGVLASWTIAALVLEQITMDQVVERLTLAVDGINYYAGGWGIMSAIASLRAARPFVVTYIREWFADVVRNQIERL